MLHFEHSLYVAETLPLRKLRQKYLDSFEMWYWRMMEHLCRLYDEVLHRLKGERNILRAVKGRKANWIVYIFRRNSLLEHVTEEKIERTGIRGRRHKHQLEEFKDKTGYRKLKEDTRSHSVGELALGEAMYQSQGRPRVRTDFEVHHPPLCWFNNKEVLCITHTVEHNHISPSSTVGIQLHVSALYVGHFQVVI